MLGKNAQQPPSSPLVSLILPIYKVEEYLAVCLDSIVSQDFSGEYEAILVNDKSPDNCGAICADYITRYPTIFRYYEATKNQGVSVCRNIGLDMTNGEYFMFVDPDDILPRNTLTSLYGAAMEEGADIVKGNNTILNNSRESAANFNCKRKRLIRNKDILTTLLLHDEVRGHPWGKLFNSARLKHYRFTPGVLMAQDLLYCAEVFSKAETLALIEDNVYIYRIRENGSKGRKFITGSYLFWLDSVEKAGSFGETKTQVMARTNLMVRTLEQLAGESRYLPKEKRKEVTKELKRRIRKWNITFRNLLFTSDSGHLPKVLYRYLKMNLIARLWAYR